MILCIFNVWYIYIFIFKSSETINRIFILSSHEKIALNVVEHLEFTSIFNLSFYNLYDSMDKFPIFLCTNSKQSFFSPYSCYADMLQGQGLSAQKVLPVGS